MTAVRNSHPDQGSLTAEAVIALPVLMLTILAGTQAALLFFARSIALAAAQEGVRAARAEHAAPGSAGPVAGRYAAKTAHGLLSSVEASSTANATTVKVQVHGRALSLVPFLSSIGVDAEAAGALERFTTATGAMP